MYGKTAVVWATVVVAVALMTTVSTAQMQALPEGVSVKVLGEFPSDTPGIAKIRVLEFRMQPGAKWEGFVEQHTSLWENITGLFTVVSGGKTIIRGPGSRWIVPKGTQADLYNNDTVVHVQHVWQLIESE